MLLLDFCNNMLCCCCLIKLIYCVLMCKTRVNLKFFKKNGKAINCPYSIGYRPRISRSRMMKRTLPLNLSRKIKLLK